MNERLTDEELLNTGNRIMQRLAWLKAGDHGIDLEAFSDDICEVLAATHQARAAVPAVQPQEPVAWIRWCSDGTYEGPIMDAQMEDVRKRSGAWTPLVPHAEARQEQPKQPDSSYSAQPKGEEATARDAARYRWLRDNPWPPELEADILLHRNARWDAAVDAALSSAPAQGDGGTGDGQESSNG